MLNTVQFFQTRIPVSKRGAVQQQLKRTSRVILEPPAKITSSRFGSDVAAKQLRAELRIEVLQVREVELKMSTALAAARNKGHENAISTTHSIYARIPHHKANKPAKTHMTITQRTITAASEDRKSEIRQRRGCAKTSSYTEKSGAPSA